MQQISVYRRKTKQQIADILLRTFSFFTVKGETLTITWLTIYDKFQFFIVRT